MEALVVKTTDPGTTDPGTQSPTTGDMAGVYGFAMLAICAGAVVLVSKKRKFN